MTNATQHITFFEGSFRISREELTSRDFYTLAQEGLSKLYAHRKSPDYWCEITTSNRNIRYDFFEGRIDCISDNHHTFDSSYVLVREATEFESFDRSDATMYMIKGDNRLYYSLNEIREVIGDERTKILQSNVITNFVAMPERFVTEYIEYDDMPA